MSDLNDLVLETFWSELKYLGNGLGRAVARLGYGPEVSKQIEGLLQPIQEAERRGIPATSIFRDAPAVILTHGLRRNPLASTTPPWRRGTWR